MQKSITLFEKAFKRVLKAPVALNDINISELEKGVAVEMEHTDDIEIAKTIASHHLQEDPKYYTKLEKIHHDEDENTVGGGVLGSNALSTKIGIENGDIYAPEDNRIPNSIFSGYLTRRGLVKSKKKKKK